MNVLLMLFAAHSELKKLSSVRDGWDDTVKDMILTSRSFVDSALCSEAEKVFNERIWLILWRMTEWGDLRMENVLNGSWIQFGGE